jgi:hypothetical protein
MCIEDRLDRHLSHSDIDAWAGVHASVPDLDLARKKVEALLSESGLVPDGRYPTGITFNLTLCDPEADSFAVDGVRGPNYAWFAVDGCDIPDALAEKLLDVLEEILRAGAVEWDLSHRATYFWSLDLNVDREAKHLERTRLADIQNFPGHLLRSITSNGGTADALSVFWDDRGCVRVAGAFSDGVACDPDTNGLAEVIRSYNISYDLHCTPDELSATQHGAEWRIPLVAQDDE